MTFDHLMLEALNAQNIPPPNGAISLDPTVKNAYTFSTVTRVELDLTGDLASSSEAQN